MSTLAYSQNALIASPYSRYGYGELQSASMGSTKSMGGIGYGVYNRRVINPMNPASYSSVDSLTFMLNFAGSGTVNGVSSGKETLNKCKGQVEYVAIQLPLCKFVGVSVGLVPYTLVGYDYSKTDTSMRNYITENGKTTVKQDFTGYGGLTQVYLGIAFDILDRVSVGVNGKYMFGNVTHTRTVSYPDASLYVGTYQQKVLHCTTFLCDVGVLYHQPIKNDELTIGATYSIKLPMTIDSQIKTVTQHITEDNTKYKFDFPHTIGFGATYRFGDKVWFGADFQWCDFSSARYYSVKDTLKSNFRIAAGVEYIPKLGSKKYGENMRFRIGANYGKSYAQINGYYYDEFAITAGLGFPLFNAMTTINLFLEYGHRGGVKTIGLVEDYFKFGIDISLNERWFVKRRLN
ncbi:MAG: hypothetical protein MJ010_01315 [Paludibacteraceae bacterium]|nr:hypothetical protein [Paludibacteraceae bacterium]